MSSKARHPIVTRSEQKAETRRLLLESARRCFGKRGYGATVVADIVRAAGVAHGTFYVHFESREAVADALLAEVNEKLSTRLLPVLERAQTIPRARTILGIARTFLDLVDEERVFARGYAERVAVGLPANALAEGVNPPALHALGVALGTQASGVSDQRLALALHGLLALWLRISMRYVLVAGTSREDTEAMLVTLTSGALDALLPAKASPRSHTRHHVERRK